MSGARLNLLLCATLLSSCGTMWSLPTMTPPASPGSSPTVPAPAAAAPKVETPQEVLKRSSASDWRPVDPQNTLYMQLPGGRVIIELAPAFAPLHAANIKALVRQQYFDGLSIVRVQDNYVVQWADPDEKRDLGAAARTISSNEYDRPLLRSEHFSALPDRDVYAPEVGFIDSWPVARDPKLNKEWLVHCYGMVGVGRDNPPDTGSGAELYAVIGHSPRHLDRNVALTGRVLQGIELLSSLPRGTGDLGFYEKSSQNVPIRSIRIAADVPTAEQTPLEVLRSDAPIFADYVHALRSRQAEWFVAPTDRVEVCNVHVPVRNR